MTGQASKVGFLLTRLSALNGSASASGFSAFHPASRSRLRELAVDSHAGAVARDLGWYGPASRRVPDAREDVGTDA
jgi:hypothetical protein